MKVENYGQLRSLELPGNWEEVLLQREPLARKQARLFIRNGNRTQQVRLVMRAGAEAESANDALFAVLSEPPHLLTKAEHAAIETVMSDLGDEKEFAIERIETALIGNRVVICIQGHWKRQQLWNKVLITVEPDEQIVQQVEFLSEIAQRAEFEPVAEQVMDTIQWR